MKSYIVTYPSEYLRVLGVVVGKNKEEALKNVNDVVEKRNDLTRVITADDLIEIDTSSSNTILLYN